MGRPRAVDPVVTKSVGFPNSIFQSILHEQDLAGSSFSNTVVILVRAGMRQRDIEREWHEKELKK